MKKLPRLSKRKRELLTLITDKINHYGYMEGANRNEKWLTNIPYTYNPTEGIYQLQSVFDRIGKISYHQCFLVDEWKHSWYNPCFLGSDFYSHSIRCHWKEPIGKGWGFEVADCMKQSLKQDAAGRWHSACDFGMWIALDHPKDQPSCEKIGSFLHKEKQIHWRPVYDYKRDEVVEALRLMSETFDWDFEEGGNMATMLI